MRRTILVTCIIVIGCNSNKQPGTEDLLSKDTLTELRYLPKTRSLQGCYRWIKGGDTATLDLEVNGNNVTGNLKYDWAEKDRNSGKLKGALKDSIITAEYTVQSEGKTSVREVALKLKGDSLLEGFGDIYINNDTARYKNISKLTFQSDHAFIKGPCR